MADPHQVNKVIQWRRLVALLATVWGAAAASVSVACIAFERTDQLGPALTVGTASLLIALLSIAPVAFFAGDLQRPAVAGRFIHAALFGSATRFSLTIILVVILDKTGMTPRQTIGLWAIFWYSLLMATELVPVAAISTGGRLSFKRSTEEPGAR